jgi:monoamine oxidase
VSTATEVVVGTADQEVRAHHVVLAVPPALAESTIALGTRQVGSDGLQPLPEPLLALVRQTPVWMGAMTKVVVAYAAPFWRDQGLAGSAVSHVGPLREIHDTSGPGGAPAALFGFLPSGDDPETTAAQAVAQLVRLFGPEAGSPTRVVVQDWSSEPETSSPATALLADHGIFGHPLYAPPALHGRLHWAGTETSPVSPGHVEGALAAGERAAAAVVSALRSS